MQPTEAGLPAGKLVFLRHEHLAPHHLRPDALWVEPRGVWGTNRRLLVRVPFSEPQPGAQRWPVPLEVARAMASQSRRLRFVPGMVRACGERVAWIDWNGRAHAEWDAAKFQAPDADSLFATLQGRTPCLTVAFPAVELELLARAVRHVSGRKAPWIQLAFYDAGPVYFGVWGADGSCRADGLIAAVPGRFPVRPEPWGKP